MPSDQVTKVNFLSNFISKELRNHIQQNTWTKEMKIINSNTTYTKSIRNTEIKGDSTPKEVSLKTEWETHQKQQMALLITELQKSFWDSILYFTSHLIIFNIYSFLYPSTPPLPNLWLHSSGISGVLQGTSSK